MNFDDVEKNRQCWLWFALFLMIRNFDIVNQFCRAIANISFVSLVCNRCLLSTVCWVLRRYFWQTSLWIWWIIDLRQSLPSLLYFKAWQSPKPCKIVILIESVYGLWMNLVLRSACILIMEFISRNMGTLCKLNDVVWQTCLYTDSIYYISWL